MRENVQEIKNWELLTYDLLQKDELIRQLIDVLERIRDSKNISVDKI